MDLLFHLSETKKPASGGFMKEQKYPHITRKKSYATN